MRTNLTPALATFLATARNAFACDLYTITLLHGTVLRWTNSDRAMTWSGTTYACGPGIERTKVRMALGLEADELRVTIFPRAGDEIDSGAAATSLRLALARGDFDGASIRLDRAYAATAGGALIGVVPQFFQGRVTAMQTDGAGGYELLCKSPLELLDAPFPRNVYQPPCMNTLFDSMCRLTRSAYRVTGSVTVGANADRTAFGTNSGASSGYFNLGVFRFLTGANAGRSLPIKSHWLSGAGYFAFPVSWPNAIALGDTYEAFPGCDKSLTTCEAKFGNRIHFRGQPFIPAPETTV